MYNEIVTTGAVRSFEILNVVRSVLRAVDKRLISHGERVAFIIYEILQEGQLFDSFEWKELFILSLLHDIGAYKTDEIDRIVEFETKEVWNHSVFGYLFLKKMTPLGDYAQAILYHHTSTDELKGIKARYKEYAQLIHLADRIDILLTMRGRDFDYTKFLKNNHGFSKEYIDLFLRANDKRNITTKLFNMNYRKVIDREVRQLRFTYEEVLSYLKMIVFSIDFRSESTVAHTSNAIVISLELANLLNLSDYQKENIYFGALLHDLGKIATPVSILEKPAGLDEEEMKIMRNHVVYTEKIIRGIVSDEICEIAIRHHEKLDGSGYPKGLTKVHLSAEQRIVAVADIMSALGGRRSYKVPFSKEKIIGIISSMIQKGQLCPEVGKVALDNYDSIMEVANRKMLPLEKIYRDIISQYNELQQLE